MRIHYLVLFHCQGSVIGGQNQANESHGTCGYENVLPRLESRELSVREQD